MYLVGIPILVACLSLFLSLQIFAYTNPQKLIFFIFIIFFTWALLYSFGPNIVKNTLNNGLNKITLNGSSVAHLYTKQSAKEVSDFIFNERIAPCVEILRNRSLENSVPLPMLPEITCDAKPIDLNIDRSMLKKQLKKYTYVPHIFQHIGFTSTVAYRTGKIVYTRYFTEDLFNNKLF